MRVLDDAMRAAGLLAMLDREMTGNTLLAFGDADLRRVEILLDRWRQLASLEIEVRREARR